MSIVTIIITSLLAGWVVNIVADALPTRRSLYAVWYFSLYCLPVAWQPLFGLSPKETVEDAPVVLRRHRLTFGLALILGFLAMTRTQDPLVFTVLAVQAWFFLAIAIIDLEHRLVLNRMLLLGIPFVLLSSLLPGAPSLFSSLLGGVAGFGFFLFLAILAPGAMGMGDVKLAGFIGLITGLSGVMAALFLGILAGGIAGAVVLIRNRFRPGNTLAYAPYLVLGIWIFLFDIVKQVHHYIGLLS